MDTFKRLSMTIEQIEACTFNYCECGNCRRQRMWLADLKTVRAEWMAGGQRAAAACDD